MTSRALVAEPRPPGRAPLLSSWAARSCPVKTHLAYDPTATLPVPPAAASPAELPPPLLQARAAEARLLEALIASAPGLVVDLRLLVDADASTEASVGAMNAGAAVIVGGMLPNDRAGQRAGRPDVLLRGADSATGRPTYHPVAVVGHKVLLQPRRTAGEDERAPAPTLHGTSLAAPQPSAPTPFPGWAFRLRSREGDLLQLAHYRRMLEAAGFATEQPLAAVLGTDTAVGGHPRLVWVDLSAPLVRTFSRSDERGWRLRSVLERYDYEHAFRREIAAVARQQSERSSDAPEPLVEPVAHDECARCPWWPRCRGRLDEDDIGLRIDKGALDVRELLALRRLGVTTVPILAATDLDTLLPRYLPLVTHRDGTEGRIRAAYRRARMLGEGVAFDRETEGPIEVPAAQVEVDFDIESSADGRVYLWGFLVHDTSRPGQPWYQQFSAFTDLDDEAEAALAGAAFAWLRELTTASTSVRVYHYSAYEPHVVTTLAERTADPLLQWAAEFAEGHFVDLYDIVKAHYFGVSGLGLKLIAAHTGFRWRDHDPGGLNSPALVRRRRAPPRRGGARGGADAGAGVQRGRRTGDQWAQSVVAIALTASFSRRRWLRSSTASTSSRPTGGSSSTSSSPATSPTRRKAVRCTAARAARSAPCGVANTRSKAPR